LKSIILFFCGIFYASSLALGQANGYYPDILSTYFFQMANANPGYIPKEGIADFNAGYKFRTGAFKDIATFSFSGARFFRTENENTHTLRILINNEQQGPFINTPRAYLNYAYELKVGEESFLYAGTAVGLAGIYYSVMLPDGSLGLGIRYKSISLGLSSYQLLNSEASPMLARFRLARYYQSNFEAEKEYGNDWKLKGYALYRLFPETTDELNVGGSALYSEAFIFGAMYRNLFGLGWFAGFYIDSGKDKLILSFTYNSPVLSRVPGLQNSMEIGLGFRVE